MAKDRTPTVIPPGTKIIKLRARRARYYGGLNGRRGGVNGPSSGGNTIGIVPAAFRN